MDFVKFIYVYNPFNVGSLISYVPGVLISPFRNEILINKGSDVENGKKNIFTRHTNFEKEYKNIDHLCLVDADDLTDEQIGQLEKLMENTNTCVTIMSHRFLEDNKSETPVFKRLSKMNEFEITKKRITYCCSCGTYDAEITRTFVENARIYEINGIKWYAKCCINCFDDEKLTKSELKSKEFEVFIQFLMKNK